METTRTLNEIVLEMERLRKPAVVFDGEGYYLVTPTGVSDPISAKEITRERVIARAQRLERDARQVVVLCLLTGEGGPEKVLESFKERKPQESIDRSIAEKFPQGERIPY